ncbi:putative RNA-directed DNA polymerase [Tanacetum coccineum]
MFQAKASNERLDVVKSLIACEPKPRASICAFVLEMKGYFDRLESLNMVFDAELSINIIISGLPADYNQFVLSYQINEKETSIMELHSLLQTTEQGIKKIDVPSTSAAPVMTVGHNSKKRKTSHSNWKRKAAKGKSDCGSKRKVESKIAPTSDPKEAVCFYCNTKGHWKRSFLKYLKDLKDGKVKKGSYSGLKESRRLKHGELNLVMGNRKIVPVTRIGKYELMPKSRVYETVECISHNGNVILNVGSSNELDKSKLWHSRLGHVNKKRIAQLQKDGVLESFDFKSDDVCESCLLGKMTKSPFTGSCERDTFEVFKLYQNEVKNQLGRKIKLTPPRTPQLNGVAERRNRTLLDMVRSMMIQETLPISFWGYALETTTHILNLVPTKKDKLEARSEKCLFVGYPEESFGYLFYKPKDNVVFVARRGVFLEREMISKEESGSKIDLEEIQESTDEEPIVNTDTQQEVVTPVKPDDIFLPIRRTSGRVSKPPQFYYGFHIEKDKISDSTLSELDEPANYKEAMASPEASKWKEAMKSEIQSMYDKQVWNLVDTTPGLKTVGLAKIKLIRIMLAIAAFHDYEILQMDVKTAFLNKKLTEDVFMAQPEGFENAKYPKRVYKLQKAIYGLKQASRSWNLCFYEKVTQFGFSRSENESCIYVQVSGSVVVFLVLYVDDILLIGNDIPTLQSVKDWLGKCFAMKDLRDAAYILGIKIYTDRSKRLIGLSQDTKDLCPKTDEELDRMSRVPYVSAVGSIMYATTCTRPDASFALSMVSRHQQNPGEGYWTTVKNIIKYLRNTKDRFIVYDGEEELSVTGYCDASWQTDRDDIRS